MSHGSESHGERFHLLNGYPGDIVPTSFEGPFTLRTAAVTDLWRKPPKVETCNAPSLVKTIQIEDFKRARVTVSADWTRLYDQGGLVLYFHDSNLDAGGGEQSRS
jgi:regulation of enolase protein 1 (concanavalin A-like superfamily)